MNEEQRNRLIDDAPGIEIRPGGGIWIKRLPVELLIGARDNPRSIKKTARKALDAMLEEFDLVDIPQYNRRTGTLCGGHQRLAWLRAKGITEVAVAVVDLDETRAKALNIGLNNPHAQGVYTDDLTKILSQIAPILPQVYSDIGLSALVSHADVAAHTRTSTAVDVAGAIEVDIGDLPTSPTSKVGDVWILGGHRLIVGDMTSGDVLSSVLGEGGGIQP